MKRTFQILFFCLLQLTLFSQQPETSLSFSNVKPKWVYYSYSSKLADSSQTFWAPNKPLVDNNELYLLTNSVINFYQGPNVEKIDLASGTLKASYQSFNKALNGRNAAYSIKKNGNFIDLYTYKENSYKVNNSIYPLWAISNYNLLRLCENNLTVCDSIITNPLDDKNKIIRMPVLVNGFGVGRNTHLFSYDDKTQYVYHYASNQESARFEILTLDKNGYMIDSNYMEFPLKYSIKNIYLREYDDNKYMSLCYATDTSGNFETKILYFKNGFIFEKDIDLSSKMQQATDFILRYYDANFFVIAAKKTKKINGVTTTFWSHYLFNHDGQLLEQVHSNGTTNLGGYATLLLPSRKIVTFEKKKVNKNQAALDFYVSDGKGNLSFTKTITTSRDITLGFGTEGMPNNHILLNISIHDSSTTIKYKNIPQWNLWVMLDPTSLNFPVATIEPSSLASFSFYPNPTNNQLMLQTELEYDVIQVYSIEGKLIQRLERQGNTIDVSALSSGMYFFELCRGERAVTRKEKFVKL